MATIFDVASAAGVSHQTVSRVVNGDPRVRPATRERVQAAVRELSYRPSAAARALASRKTRTLGLISMGVPFYGPASIMHGFDRAARAAGYQVSMATLEVSERGAIRTAIDALLGQNVMAIVLIAPDDAAVTALQDIDIPVPLLTADSGGAAGIHSVTIDQAAGAALALRHLAGLGHRSVAHVAGPATWTDARERERGWFDEGARLGLELPPVLRGDWTSTSGYRVGVELVARGDLTAVFCANDQMALGVVHAFAEAGLRVPEDVSVVGFDDIPEAEHFLPPLTTVRQDFVALGQRIMAGLERLLSGEAVDVVTEVPSLIVRSSTAPPPGPGVRDDTR